jgi:putative transposase
VIINYIERYKNAFGVEPIGTTLTSADVPIAPSTFYAARTRPPSARAVPTRAQACDRAGPR